MASSTGFYGYNINRSNSSVTASPNHLTPSPKTSSLNVPESARLAAGTAAWTNRNRENSETVSPDGGSNLAGEGALGRWITAMRPGSSPPASPANPPPPHIVRGESRNNSFGGDSDSASRWHGRDDSCAASCWQGINISDNESSNQDDGSAATRDWTRSEGSSRHHVSHSEWGGLGATLDSRVSASVLGNTIASSFFDNRDSPNHRTRESLAMFGDEDGEEATPSPGGMTRAGSVWNSSRSRYEGPEHRGGSESGEEENAGAAMSRWDGSSAPSPAGRSPHARSGHF